MTGTLDNSLIILTLYVGIPREFNVARNVVRNVARNVVWGLEHSVQGRFSELRDAAATASMDRNNNRKTKTPRDV